MTELGVDFEKSYTRPGHQGVLVKGRGSVSTSETRPEPRRRYATVRRLRILVVVDGRKAGRGGQFETYVMRYF